MYMKLVANKQGLQLTNILKFTNQAAVFAQTTFRHGKQYCSRMIDFNVNVIACNREDVGSCVIA